ncbi:putative holin-like toxin [Granulicatella sp.]
MIFGKRYSLYEALTLMCSFATLLVALLALIVKIIELVTKK